MRGLFSGATCGPGRYPGYNPRMSAAPNLFLLFLSSAAVALTGAVMPGPLSTAVVSESIRRGPLAGPLFILGHAILELALFLCIVGGVGPTLALPGVAVATGIVGGLIMLFTAWSREPPRDGSSSREFSCPCRIPTGSSGGSPSAWDTSSGG